MKEYNEDMFEKLPSTVIDKFLADEHMNADVKRYIRVVKR